MKLTDLPNIGPSMAARLEAVGIHSYEELKTEGSLQALLKIHAYDKSG